MRERELLNAGLARLRDLLEEGSGFELRAAATGEAAVDSVWTIRAGGGESTIAVEAKRTIWPRDVGRVATQLFAYAREAGVDRCLVLSPSLTERTRELLTASDIDFLDLRGNARITVPGRVLIRAQGDGEAWGDEIVSRDRIVNPFRGKASRIVRALLAEPGRWWGVTELAGAVDVSAGLSVKTLKTLGDGAYVRRDQERQVRLADGEALLRRWAEAAGNAFRGAARFTSSVPDPDELTARLSAGLEDLGIRYALSRLAAARFIEPYAAARVVDVYVEDTPDILGSALDLLPVERGESVRLVRPPDEGVFQFCRERDGMTVVNAAQLFVDLQNGGGREPDVAERLFETTLQGLIGQDGER